MDRGTVNWAVVISSHLARTLLEWSQKIAWRLKSLDYGLRCLGPVSLLEGSTKCWRPAKGQTAAQDSQSVGIGLIVVFGVVLLLVARTQKASVSCRTEQLTPPALTAADLAVAPVVRTGPGRPSDRIRRREERA